METAPAHLLPLGRMARRVHVTTAWLRDEAEAGRVPCLKAATRYLFDPEAVALSLAERARQKPLGEGGGP